MQQLDESQESIIYGDLFNPVSDTVLCATLGRYTASSTTYCRFVVELRFLWTSARLDVDLLLTFDLLSTCVLSCRTSCRTQQIRASGVWLTTKRFVESHTVAASYDIVGRRRN